jgi:hypothetical protein
MTFSNMLLKVITSSDYILLDIIQLIEFIGLRLPLSNVETVEVHNFVPGGDKVVDELLL